MRIEFIKTQTPDVQSDPLFKDFINKFCKQMMERADNMGKRNFGECPDLVPKSGILESELSRVV